MNHDQCSNNKRHTYTEQDMCVNYKNTKPATLTNTWFGQWIMQIPKTISNIKNINTVSQINYITVCVCLYTLVVCYIQNPGTYMLRNVMENHFLYLSTEYNFVSRLSNILVEIPLENDVWNHSDIPLLFEDFTKRWHINKWERHNKKRQRSVDGCTSFAV